MLTGQTCRVEALSLHRLFLAGGDDYAMGSLPGEHAGHTPIRPGMVVVAAEDSARNGDTLVRLPCTCQVLLLRHDAA